MKPAPRQSSLIQRERLFGWSLLAPCLFFVALFAFYPIVQSIVLSLHQIILSLPQLGDPLVGLSNYLRLAQDPEALRALANTCVFVLGSTLLELGLGLVIALVMD
ncbi:sugar ABC transporter permease, partial [Patescibacteria group bacterium]|nr:sugar ABC transporter permease [Patescibacteria group bacterium]